MADKTQYNFYQLWYKIKLRCDDKNNPNYPRYGGRGISLSDRWRDYQVFKKDMYSTYKKGLQIERIDNNGDYELSNCRWATRREQANNRRDTRFITYGGVTKTLSYWAEEVGIKFSTLRQRYYVYKWDIEKCLTHNNGDKIGR
ncbi:MAG: hypothetical protein GY804_09780 [Alphaproteobacteria bacterium]|nr:hypothetical protein [Alphaproteobacteria bacterium]